VSDQPNSQEFLTLCRKIKWPDGYLEIITALSRDFSKYRPNNPLPNLEMIYRIARLIASGADVLSDFDKRLEENSFSGRLLAAASAQAKKEENPEGAA